MPFIDLIKAIFEEEPQAGARILSSQRPSP